MAVAEVVNFGLIVVVAEVAAEVADSLIAMQTVAIKIAVFVAARFDVVVLGVVSVFLISAV